jgi:hypothetical protein
MRLSAPIRYLRTAIGSLFTKVQGRSGLVVCDMEFTGLTQRLWVRGDSMRGPSYANILSGRFLFVLKLTNQGT